MPLKRNSTPYGRKNFTNLLDEITFKRTEVRVPLSHAPREKHRISDNGIDRVKTFEALLRFLPEGLMEISRG